MLGRAGRIAARRAAAACASTSQLRTRTVSELARPLFGCTGFTSAQPAPQRANEAFGRDWMMPAAQRRGMFIQTQPTPNPQR